MVDVPPRPEGLMVRVWRRVPGGRMVEDARDPSGWRCNSGTFVPKRGGEPTSVDLADEREAAGHEPIQMLDGCAGRWGVVEVAVDADLVRPDPQQDNPFHAELRGTPRTYRALAKEATWVLTPVTLPMEGADPGPAGS